MINIHNFPLHLSALSPLHYMAEKCGHRTKRTGQMSVFGEKVLVRMPKNKNNTVDYCIDCIGRMAIRCAWCGKPILIGEPITLYSPSVKEFQIPEHAVIYNREPLQLVGCFRGDCAETGADRAGFWLPNERGEGHVLRVPTPFELIMGNHGVHGTELY